MLQYHSLLFNVQLLKYFFNINSFNHIMAYNYTEKCSIILVGNIFFQLSDTVSVFGDFNGSPMIISYLVNLL